LEQLLRGGQREERESVPTLTGLGPVGCDATDPECLGRGGRESNLHHVAHRQMRDGGALGVDDNVIGGDWR
jgi:hypothetical protein